MKFYNIVLCAVPSMNCNAYSRVNNAPSTITEVQPAMIPILLGNPTSSLKFKILDYVLCGDLS